MSVKVGSPSQLLCLPFSAHFSLTQFDAFITIVYVCVFLIHTHTTLDNLFSYVYLIEIMALYEMHVLITCYFYLSHQPRDSFILTKVVICCMSVVHSWYNFICLSFWWEFLIYFVFMRKFQRLELGIANL